MKSRIARFGVLAAAVVGLMATMTPPASATHVKVVVFTGTAEVPGGLGYPGVAQGGGADPTKIPCTDNLSPDPNCVEVKTGPKGEPQVNLRPEGNHSNFSFNALVCAKVTVSVDPAKKTPGPQLCGLTASGAVWGYCGLSTGMGVATLVDTTPQLPPPAPPGIPPTKQTQSTQIKFTGVGGVLYVTGGTRETNLYAVVLAVPLPSAPGGPTCTMKTADQFQLTGVAVVKDCTPTTDVPVVCDGI